MVSNDVMKRKEERKEKYGYTYSSYNKEVLNTNAQNTEIGKTIASDKFPNTMDSFWFFLSEYVLINPFDFVTVEHLKSTKTIGIVKELQAIEDHDNYLFKHSITDPLPAKVTNIKSQPRDKTEGLTLAKVAVMANTGIKSGLRKGKISMGMPVGIGKPVKFAAAKEVMFALGIPDMSNPIPAGIIDMTNSLQVPIFLDISYLAGPDTAHINASGISGNLKTSYLLFLLQSVYQKLGNKEEEVAIIIFNTKEEDLLHIDKKQSRIDEWNKKLFNILKLDAKYFDNVTYFLPRGRDGRPNSIHIPIHSKTYSYELQDVYDRLELLFSEVYDPQYNLSSILNYIYEFWPIKNSTGKKVVTWTDLFKFNDYPSQIIMHKSSLLHFQGHLQRFRKSPMFIDRKVTSTYLGNEIKNIKGGDVFVIDIAMISTLEEQAFVVGDAMKSIDEMYSSRFDPSNSVKKKKPKYILILIDEINRFIPKLHPAVGRMTAVAEQIMKTAIAGRSRGTVLFSAQQFKSTVDYVFHQNVGMHVTAKLGSSELSTSPYDMIDVSTKMSIVTLNKGELILIHPAFRHPIKIVFPMTASFKNS